MKCNECDDLVEINSAWKHFRKIHGHNVKNSRNKMQNLKLQRRKESKSYMECICCEEFFFGSAKNHVRAKHKECPNKNILETDIIAYNRKRIYRMKVGISFWILHFKYLDSDMMHLYLFQYLKNSTKDGSNEKAENQSEKNEKEGYSSEEF